jgi:hypothetical protein
LHFVLDDDPMPIRRIEYELSAGRRDIICGARKNASREAAGMQFLKQVCTQRAIGWQSELVMMLL